MRDALSLCGCLIVCGFVCVVGVLRVALYVLYVWCASGMCGCDLCVAVFDRLCVVCLLCPVRISLWSAG